MKKIEPLSMLGQRVRLEPLREEHAEALWEAGRDPSIWTWIPCPVTSQGAMREGVLRFCELAERGLGQAFTQVHVPSGRVVGSSAYLNPSYEDDRVEIGYTWISPEWQRTGLNREAKLLLLENAFERLGAYRVEFKTDVRNDRSRRAILALGAREEGILRGHMKTGLGTPAERMRDTIYFSILKAEWPKVKARLVAGLEGSNV